MATVINDTYGSKYVYIKMGFESVKLINSIEIK